MNHSTINLTLGVQLFSFSSHQEWVCKAQARFTQSGHKADNIICVDRVGRICKIGRDFRIANEENQFPVIAYLYRPL